MIHYIHKINTKQLNGKEVIIWHTEYIIDSKGQKQIIAEWENGGGSMILREGWNEIKARHANNVVGFKIGDQIMFFDVDAVKVGILLDEPIKNLIDDDGTFIKSLSVAYKEKNYIPNLIIYERMKEK